MKTLDFVIIGAMRAGTSSLHHNLQQHPDIEMTKFKEPNFFNHKFDLGLDWYRNLFVDDAKFYGDATPNYARVHKSPNTAKNLFSVFPETKIVYILRDPIDRIISHIHHNLYRDRLNIKDVSQLQFSGSSYLNISRYAFQLQSFLEYFPEEQIKLVSFEQLKKEPGLFYTELLNFLNIQDFPNNQSFKSFNSSKITLPYL